MPVAERLAGGAGFKVEAAACVLPCASGCRCTPAAPTPGLLWLTWTCTSSSPRESRLCSWRNFFHHSIQCSHTYGIHLFCMATGSLFHFQIKRDRRLDSHVASVVQSLVERTPGSGSHLRHLSHFLVRDTVSSSCLHESDSWEVADPESEFIPCDFKASGSVSYLLSYFQYLA